MQHWDNLMLVMINLVDKNYLLKNDFPLKDKLIESLIYLIKQYYVDGY
jgi:hypothetical protein